MLVIGWLFSLVACGGGSGPTAPTISSQPQSITVNDGSPVAFSVGAAGSTPISYQWFKDGVAISGASFASLQIPSAALQDNTARFHVTLSNAVGSVTSQTAVLTVRPVPLSITAQPTSVTVPDGGSATFTVVATGSLPMGYQWLRDGTAIVGATAASHVVAPATLAVDSSKFSVNINNPAGSVVSATATLTVAPVAPSFSLMPASVTAKDGASTTLAVQVAGSAPIDLQWYRNGVAIVGATATTLQFSSTLGNNGDSFWVTAINKYGSATSSTTVLHVDPNAPSFLLEPANVSTLTGGSANFLAQVSGTAPLSIQWQRSGDNGYSWTDIVGATGSSFGIANATLEWAKTLVRAVVTNRVASIASRAAELNVLPTIRLIAGGFGGIGYRDGAPPDARLGAITGLTVDKAGNAYIADNMGPAVRKLTPSGIVSTWFSSAELNQGISALAIDSKDTLYVATGRSIFTLTTAGVLSPLAGSATNSGAVDGVGDAARFESITGITVDANGNAFVIDKFKCTIRKVSPTGVVTTIAGAAGSCAQTDGVASAARFISPGAITVDKQGTLYVADGSAVRSIASNGMVSRFAGQYGVPGFSDGQRLTGAQMYSPAGLATDDQGNLIVADTWSIRRVSADGIVSTVAGSNPYGISSVDGFGSGVTIYGGAMLAATPTANTYLFVETGNSLVRKVNLNGGVVTVAGKAPDTGTTDGIGSAAKFIWPQCASPAADGGSMYVADNGGRIRRVWPDGRVVTVAKSVSVLFSSYSYDCVAADSRGNLYMTDNFQHVIYKATPAGAVSILAGVFGQSGSADGPPGVGLTNKPFAIAVDTRDNVFFGEWTTGTIRKVTPDGTIVTVAGKANECGVVNGPASSARFCVVTALAADPDGSLLISDSGSIRRLDQSGMVTTVAGMRFGFGYGDGPVGTFTNISGMSVDAAGYIYVADLQNSLIRRVSRNGYTTTVMGQRNVSSATLGVNSSINQPRGVAVLSSGRLLLLSEYAVLGD
jgi:sugar lactone lactonase YvrE